jgi:Predicted membrane protein, hemolysin III homolog
MTKGRPQSRREELANVVTHGTGLAASLVGTPAPHLGRQCPWGRLADCRLQRVCCQPRSSLRRLNDLPRAADLARQEPPADPRSRGDLPADCGSYTPFTLGVLRGAWGWTLFGLVWGLAAVGILHKTILGFRFPRLSTLMYLAMGWLAVVAIGPLAGALPAAGLALLFAGGLCYTVGVVLFVRDTCPHRHALWHVCVVAGSACHYAAVLRYATGSHP